MSALARARDACNRVACVSAALADGVSAIQNNSTSVAARIYVFKQVFKDVFKTRIQVFNLLRFQPRRLDDARPLGDLGFDVFGELLGVVPAGS